MATAVGNHQSRRVCQMLGRPVNVTGLTLGLRLEAAQLSGRAVPHRSVSAPIAFGRPWTGARHKEEPGRFLHCMRGAENASWLLRRVFHERGSNSHGLPFKNNYRVNMLRKNEQLTKKVLRFGSYGIDTERS